MERADSRSPWRRARRASREPTEHTILEQLGARTYIRRVSGSPRSSVGSVTSPSSVVKTSKPVRQPVGASPRNPSPTMTSQGAGAAFAGLVAGSLATFVVMRQLAK